LLAGTSAVAQAYPERPIRLVHGFAAGGNADVIARILAADLTRQLGQQVNVEAKPGAGGTLAADSVAKSKPDGYTLLLATGGHAIAAALYEQLPYDTLKSFESVSAVTSFPFLLVVNASSPVNNLTDLLASPKAATGGITYGTAGNGTGQHMTAALFAHRTGVAMTHVPYRGDAGSVTALLGGEIDFVVAPPTAVIQHVRTGRLRPIAISSANRWSGLPNVATVAEQKVPQYEVRSWTALLAPAGTPKAVVDRLNTAVGTALRDDAIRQKLEEVTGGDVRGSTPKELQAGIESDVRRWSQLVRDAGIKKD
jgi:tripartite-type tricarboxylate transporter receptor subunit TctC